MSGNQATRYVLATSLLARLRGLLGTKANWGDGLHVLAIVPCKSIHTLGMRYTIDVAFCNMDGVVLRSGTNVVPGRLLACRKAAFVLERPHQEDGWPHAGELVPICTRTRIANSTCERSRQNAHRE